MAAGLFDLDLPADIRDLGYDITNWETTPEHIAQTALDVAGLLPLIGAIKYGDEIGTLAKNIGKHAEADEVAKIAGESIEVLSKTTEESVNKKLSKYLLDFDHPTGGSKAKWYNDALGFTKDNSDYLAKQIVFDPKNVAEIETNIYGTKYSQIIPIQGVNGRIIILNIYG